MSLTTSPSAVLNVILVADGRDGTNALDFTLSREDAEAGVGGGEVRPPIFEEVWDKGGGCGGCTGEAVACDMVGVP